MRTEEEAVDVSKKKCHKIISIHTLKIKYDAYRNRGGVNRCSSR
jgi:hypothetical protein